MSRGDAEGLDALRGLLHEAPSEQGWAAVCEALESLPPAQQQVGLEYALEHLERWPDEMRCHATVPSVWAQNPPVWWPAVRTLEFERPSWRSLRLGEADLGARNLRAGDFDDVEMPFVGRALERCAQVTSLEGAHLFWRPEVVEMLADAPRQSGLRAFSTGPYSMGRRDDPIGPLAFSKLIASGVFDGIERLDIGAFFIGDEGAAALASSPCFERLERLSVSFNDIGSQGGLALMEAPWLEGVEALRLGDNRFDAEVVAALAARNDLQALRELNLVGCPIGTEGFAALGAAASLAGVARLHLGANQGEAERDEQTVGDLWMRELVKAPFWGKLVDFGFTHNGMGVDGVEALVGHLSTPVMRRLNLGTNRIGDEGVALLSSCGGLRELELLMLYDVECGLEGVDALSRNFNQTSLKSLSLGSNRRLGDDAVRILVASGMLDGIKDLSLPACGLGPESARLLASCEGLSNLRALSLHSNALGSEGAVALASSPHLSNLNILRLNRCQIGSEGGVALASSPHLSNLTSLMLMHNAIEADGFMALASSRYLSRLQSLNVRRNPAGREAIVALRTSEAFPSLVSLSC